MTADSVPTPAPDLKARLVEAFNSCHMQPTDESLIEMYRHDGHTRDGACYVCRGDVGQLADRALSEVVEPELSRLRLDVWELRGQRDVANKYALEQQARAHGMWPAVVAARDEARAERASMVRDLHAAIFDGSTSLPDRPLDTVHEWLLGLVRADRARIDAASRSGWGAGNTTPTDEQVDQVALFLLRTKVYGTNASARCAAAVANQWQCHLTADERKHWRGWARKLIAESGWGAVTNPTDGAGETVRLPKNWQDQIAWLLDVRQNEVFTKVTRLIEMWQGKRSSTEDDTELPAGPVVPAPTDPLADDPALAVLRAKLKPEECRATEGGMGVDCHLTPGHDGWHNASHTPFTDGTESIGYPFHIQWPRTKWDRCAPPALAGVEALVANAIEREASPCECPDPDWYHDGVAARVDGRLCRKCRRREGREIAREAWRTGTWPKRPAPPAVSEEGQAQDAPVVHRVTYSAGLGGHHAYCEGCQVWQHGTEDAVQDWGGAHFADTFVPPALSALSAPTKPEENDR